MPIIKEINRHFKSKPIEYEIKENGCWECTSHSLNNAGYPSICRNSKKQNIHRYVYKITKGFKNTENHILHSCDNKLCINPDHLHEGTHTQNMKEARERGLMTSQKRAENYNSKLTKDQCLNIYHRYKRKKENMGKLAKEFNCSRSTINKITLAMHWSTKNLKPLYAPKRKNKKINFTNNSYEKKKRKKGYYNPKAKLNPELGKEIIKIKKQKKISNRKLAKIYDVSPNTIRRVLNHKHPSTRDLK
jgi:transposase-like protein